MNTDNAVILLGIDSMDGASTKTRSLQMKRTADDTMVKTEHCRLSNVLTFRKDPYYISQQLSFTVMSNQVDVGL